MKARQNPLARFEAFIQRLVEGPFARLFPSRLEPIEIERKLERVLQGEGRRLAPNIYDVFLSIKDHQQISPSQAVLIRDWQNNLVEFARHRRYTLRTVPIIRLHADSSLSPSIVRIETEIADRQGGADGGMATQALSAEQLAQLRAQLPAGQNLPGIGSSSHQPSTSGPLGAQAGPGHGSHAHQPPTSYRPPAAPVAQPQAWLTIRLPSGGQENYRIEKPIVNIGRQLSNDIIVEDKRVSRYHAQIKFQPDGQFAIFDLGSTNGITINMTPHMRQHVLRNGDSFTIGSYDFHFERR